MDLTISITPIFIAILIFVIIFMITVAILSVHEISESRILHDRIIDADEKDKNKPITVFIESLNSFDSITATLDHLYSFNYKNLKLVVFINSSANNGAKLKLKKHIRSRRYKNLKIVHDNDVSSIQEVVRLHADGGLFMVLKTGERLSDGFFETVSVKSGYNLGAIVAWPQHVLGLDNRIISAIKAIEIIWGQLLDRVIGKKLELWPIIPGVVYKRKNPKLTGPAKTPYKIRADYKLYILDTNIDNKLLYSLSDSIKKAKRFLTTRIGKVAIIILLVLMSVVFTLLSSSDLLLSTASIVVIYILLTLIAQTQLGYYSLFSSVSLVLVAPLSLIFSLLVLMCGFVLLIIDLIRGGIKNIFLSSYSAKNN